MARQAWGNFVVAHELPLKCPEVLGDGSIALQMGPSAGLVFCVDLMEG